jgi:hypothetical protein
MALVFLPRSFEVYSRRAPKLPLFDRWAKIAARAVNRQKGSRANHI